MLQRLIMSGMLTLGALVGIAHGIDTSVPFIHADAVHAQGITGRGVTVAVIDEGVFDWVLPAGSIAKGGATFLEGTSAPGGDAVTSVHGTLVAMVIVDPNGVAPGAKILPIRVLGPDLDPRDFNAMRRAIYYVTMRKRVDPTIRVMNLSFGLSRPRFPYGCESDDHDFTRLLGPAVQAATDAGILCVASSGNEADCGVTRAPACFSQVLPVAASYDDGGYPLELTFDSSNNFWVTSCSNRFTGAYGVCCFSNVDEHNPYMMAAPGYDIRLLTYPGQWGTSLAAPHVSGVAALVFEKSGCDNLDALTARSRIYQSGWDYWWASAWCPSPLAPRHVDALRAVNAVVAGACPMLGDLNCDGTIDAADFRHMLHCVKGPNGQASVGFCGCGNYPQRRDDTVDMADFAQFQLAFTGYGSGACCHPEGYCTIEPVNVCAEEFMATYQGHGTTCEGLDCPLIGAGACCRVRYDICEETSLEGCAWGEGLYMGEGVRCAETTCPTARYHNIAGSLSSYVASGPGVQLADDITLEPVEPPADAALGYYDLAVYGGNGGPFDVTVGLYTECPGMGGELIPGTEYTFTDNPDNGSPVFLTATFDWPAAIPGRFWMVATFSNELAGWFPAGQADANIGWTADVFGRYDLGEPPEEPHWVCNYWWGGDPNEPDHPWAGFWANIGCVEPVGACCHADLSCTEGTLAECAAAGGYYQGHGLHCVDVDCSTAHNGACCSYDDGVCRQTSLEFCESKGSRYEGDGTICEGRTCLWGRYRNEDLSVSGWAHPQWDGTTLADDMSLEGTGARDLAYYNLLAYGGTPEGEPQPFNVTAWLYDGSPCQGGMPVEGTEFTWTVPDDGQPHLLEVDLSGSPVPIPDTVWMAAEFSRNTAGWILAWDAEVGETSYYIAANNPWYCEFAFGPWPCCPGGFWANLRCVAPGGPRSGASPVLSITPVPLEVAPAPLSYEPPSGAQATSSSEPMGPAAASRLHPIGETPMPGFGERRLDPRPVRVLPGGAWSGPSSRSGAKSRSPATVTLELTSPSTGQVLLPGQPVEWTVSATVSQGDNAGLALVIADLVQNGANPELFDIPPAYGLHPAMDYFVSPQGISNPAPDGGVVGYFGTPVGPEGAKNLIQIGGAQNTFGEPGEVMGMISSVTPAVGQAGPQIIAQGSFLSPATPGMYTFQLENGIANVLNVIDPPPIEPDFWPVSAAGVVFGSPSISFMVCVPPCTWQVPAQFGTIQAAIDAAQAGDTILVADGVYTGTGNKNLDLQGKAIHLRSESGNPSGCIIDCEGNGRGFYLHSGETADTVIRGFTITRGAPDSLAPGGGVGGGVYCQGASPTLVNCGIVWNVAGGGPGGGLYCDGASPTLVNCTITANEGLPQNGGIYCTSGIAPTLTNCILWGDAPPEIDAPFGAPIVTYSSIQGGWAGTGNLNADPVFLRLPDLGPDLQFGTTDDDWGDIHLAGNSLCIDAGDPTWDYSLEPEPNGGRLNMGAYGNTVEAEGKTWVHVDGYTLVSRSCVDGSVFDYRLKVRVKNWSESAATAVLLDLQHVTDNVTIIEPLVDVGSVPAGATVTSTDTFKLRANRETLPSQLRVGWRVTYSLGGPEEERSFVGWLSREKLEPPQIPIEREPVPQP